MDKLFQLSKLGTNVKTEVIAGITTFLTMAYIIIVNPAILSTVGVPFNQVFIATIRLECGRCRSWTDPQPRPTIRMKYQTITCQWCYTAIRVPVQRLKWIGCMCAGINSQNRFSSWVKNRAWWN